MASPNIVGQAAQIIDTIMPMVDALSPFLPVQVKAVVEVAKLAIRAGENVSPYVSQLVRLSKGEKLTPAESVALVTARERLSATLQAPLPPEEV